jgi:hypothetical protein
MLILTEFFILPKHERSTDILREATYLFKKLNNDLWIVVSFADLKLSGKHIREKSTFQSQECY